MSAIPRVHGQQLWNLAVLVILSCSSIRLLDNEMYRMLINSHHFDYGPQNSWFHLSTTCLKAA